MSPLKMNVSDEKTLLIVEDDRPLRERLARATERRPGKVPPGGFPSGRATQKKAMA
jgi:ActR/RegA family two-component response regulator